MRNDNLWDDVDLNTSPNEIKPIVEDIKITPKAPVELQEENKFHITEDTPDTSPSDSLSYADAQKIDEENKNKAKHNEQQGDKPPIGNLFKIILLVGCIAVCTIAFATKFLQPQNQNTLDTQQPTVSITEDLSDEKHETLGSVDIKDVEISVEKITTTDVSDLVEDVIPSIVAISALSEPHAPGFNGLTEDGQWKIENELSGNASGVIIGDNKEEIWIVTNAHVVDKAKAIMVTFCDNKNVVAYFKGYYLDDDIAVISVKTSELDKSTVEAIACMKLGDSDAIKPGQGIITVGNALGYGQAVTTGVISATDRTITTENGSKLNVIQIDAAINPGNSGGALLDVKGNLIGITTAKSSAAYTEGMGFAIPVNNIKEKLEVLCAKDARMHAIKDTQITLGVNVSDTYVGPMIVSIDNESIAFNSDLSVGDVILELEGTKITSTEQFAWLLKFYRKGESIKVVVNRPNGNQYQSIELTIKL